MTSEDFGRFRAWHNESGSTFPNICGNLWKKVVFRVKKYGRIPNSRPVKSETSRDRVKERESCWERQYEKQLKFHFQIMVMTRRHMPQAHGTLVDEPPAILDRTRPQGESSEIPTTGRAGETGTSTDSGYIKTGKEATMIDGSSKTAADIPTSTGMRKSCAAGAKGGISAGTKIADRKNVIKLAPISRRHREAQGRRRWRWERRIKTAGRSERRFTDTLSGKKWRGKMAKARADIRLYSDAKPRRKRQARRDQQNCRSARERRKRRGKRGHQNRQRAVNKRPTDTIWDSDQKARQFWIEQERRKRRERQGIKNAGARWIDGRFT
ncbi:hypothetical protein C8R44DRAFT_863141 [Mycena epipterygia]|nr:hypothetical protein C8R44DRAFT_863141 [Mycena epipterygia]